MLYYVLRRIGTAALVLLGAVTITFVLAHSISVNPIAAWVGKSAANSPSLVEIYTREYHLNDPLYVQYFYYFIGLIHLQLGFSPSRGEPVFLVISQTLPYTLQLIILAVIFATIIGIAGAIVSTKFAGSVVEKAIKLTYIGSYATPAFMMPLVLLLVFASLLKIFPTSGVIDPFVSPPTPITGMPMLDSILENNWTAFFSLLKHAILPSLAIALALYGILTRVLSSSIDDIMRSIFVKAARSRGISENNLLIHYGLKNSLLQLITLIALILTFSLYVDVFVENIFSYSGLGQYAVEAIQALDYPGILATTIVYTVIIVVMNLAADLLYSVVDPRVRLS